MNSLLILYMYLDQVHNKVEQEAEEEEEDEYVIDANDGPLVPV